MTMTKTRLLSHKTREEHSTVLCHMSRMHPEYQIISPYAHGMHFVNM